MQFCWALLGQLELQVIILCRFIISNLFYIVIWYTNIYWWIFQNYRVNKVGLECGGRVDTKHNASSSSVNMSPSESSSLQSFVSGCLWLWANLLEAKCLYLGQLRIRSHVVSATLAHMLPQNFLTIPPPTVSVCQQWLSRMDGLKCPAKSQGDAVIKDRCLCIILYFHAI